jgi:hypothetical protein
MEPDVKRPCRRPSARHQTLQLLRADGTLETVTAVVPLAVAGAVAAVAPEVAGQLDAPRLRSRPAVAVAAAAVSTAAAAAAAQIGTSVGHAITLGSSDDEAEEGSSGCQSPSTSNAAAHGPHAGTQRGGRRGAPADRLLGGAAGPPSEHAAPVAAREAAATFRLNELGAGAFAPTVRARRGV